MKKEDALKQLNDLDKKGIFVYTLNDLSKVFPNENGKTLLKSAERLVASGILERATKGLYVFTFSKHKGKYLIETIAATLRRGQLTYISLESALSEYGAISQIPMGIITLMTTGAAGRFETTYGIIIEFVKTRRNYLTLLKETVQYLDSPLRIALPKRAYGDLKRVGRNVSMVNEAALKESIE